MAGRWMTVKIPGYSRSEELINALTHGAGASLAVAALVLMEIRADNAMKYVTASIFGSAMILTYAMSCIYHAFPASVPGKKILRILDHCNVYILVFGTYIPATLVGIRGALGWVLFGIVAGFTAIGITLSCVDVDRFSVLEVICHLINGWSILLGLPYLLRSAGMTGVFYMALGGIFYSVGAVLYGIGSRKRYIHSIFHLFCLLGSGAHFWVIYRYLL